MSNSFRVIKKSVFFATYISVFSLLPAGAQDTKIDLLQKQITASFSESLERLRSGRAPGTDVTS